MTKLRLINGGAAEECQAVLDSAKEAVSENGGRAVSVLVVEGDGTTNILYSDELDMLDAMKVLDVHKLQLFCAMSGFYDDD